MSYHFTQRRDEIPSNDEPSRTAYEKDKGRIIHSEAFRRLQAKTQIMQIADGDFHRTRLTHSIEVAQIGRGISRFINFNHGEFLKSSGIELDHDLIESICLAHDIGHPPFGHGGEIALNYMMRKHGGFEGNAQTLRIVAKLGKYTKGFGMNLTRRTTLGLLKYPTTYEKLFNLSCSIQEKEDYSDLDQIKWMPPKCYYTEDQPVVDWLLKNFSDHDTKLFTSVESVNTDEQTQYRQQAKFKSFDCSVMDMADDISYCVHDFEDGLELGGFKQEQLDNFIHAIFANDHFQWYLKKVKAYPEHKIQSLKELSYPKHFISVCVGYFLQGITISKKSDQFDCPYLQYEVRLNAEAQALLNEFGKIVWDSIIMAPHTQEFVKQGQKIICCLFEAFCKDHSLLPDKTQNKLGQGNNDFRVICDYVSGMTDRYALTTYTQLFGHDHEITIQR